MSIIVHRKLSIIFFYNCINFDAISVGRSSKSSINWIANSICSNINLSLSANGMSIVGRSSWWGIFPSNWIYFFHWHPQLSVFTQFIINELLIIFRVNILFYRFFIKCWDIGIFSQMIFRKASLLNIETKFVELPIHLF